MEMVDRRYKILALAVINQAVYDYTTEYNKNRVGDKDKKTAKRFLNNSQELEFFADIGDCRDNMIKLGFLREER